LEIYLCIYAVWNLVVFIIYGADKRKAVRGKWRISETALILTAFLSGGLGAMLGMSFFHHKTKKLKFKILIPVAMVLNIVTIVGIGMCTK